MLRNTPHTTRGIARRYLAPWVVLLLFWGMQPTAAAAQPAESYEIYGIVAKKQHFKYPHCSAYLTSHWRLKPTSEYVTGFANFGGDFQRGVDFLIEPLADGPTPGAAGTWFQELLGEGYSVEVLNTSTTQVAGRKRHHYRLKVAVKDAEGEVAIKQYTYILPKDEGERGALVSFTVFLPDWVHFAPFWQKIIPTIRLLG